MELILKTIVLLFVLRKGTFASGPKDLKASKGRTLNAPRFPHTPEFALNKIAPPVTALRPGPPPNVDTTTKTSTVSRKKKESLVRVSDTNHEFEETPIASSPVFKKRPEEVMPVAPGPPVFDIRPPDEVMPIAAGPPVFEARPPDEVMPIAPGLPVFEIRPPEEITTISTGPTVFEVRPPDEVMPIAPGLPVFEIRPPEEVTTISTGPTVFEVQPDPVVRVRNEDSTQANIATNTSTTTNMPDQHHDRMGLSVFENKTQKLPGTMEIEHSGIILGLCGFPPYYDREICIKQNYYRDPLSGCEQTWGRYLFGIFIGIAAIGIILINSLILIVFARNSEMRSQYEYIKVSLAFADVIIGFLLFATVIPNMLWIRNLTEQEVVQFVTEDANSINAIFVGSLIIVTTQASLLHLVFLSIERFMAINWSFWHINRKTRTVIYTIVGIWTTSIVAAFIPAVFPDYFEYQFQPALLIHMLTTKTYDEKDTNFGYQGTIYAVATMILPYIIMVVFCILTGVVSHQKLRSTVRIFGAEHTNSGHSGTKHMSSTASGPLSPVNPPPKRRLRPEISVFFTILIMISAYTLTLLPFTIVVILYTEGLMNCSNYQIPFAVSFYFGLLNSLANGIIYSARDLKFRSAVRNLFCSGNNQTSNSKKILSFNSGSSASRV